MSFAAVVTIIGVVLTVLALAGYLIYVALLLRGVDRRLSAINVGIAGITGKAGAAGPVILEINAALTGVNNALQGVLTKKRPPKAAAPAPAPATVQQSPPSWVVTAPAGQTEPIRRVDPFKR